MNKTATVISANAQGLHSTGAIVRIVKENIRTNDDFDKYGHDFMRRYLVPGASNLNLSLVNPYDKLENWEPSEQHKASLAKATIDQAQEVDPSTLVSAISNIIQLDRKDVRDRLYGKKKDEVLQEFANQIAPQILDYQDDKLAIALADRQEKFKAKDKQIDETYVTLQHTRGNTLTKAQKQQNTRWFKSQPDPAHADLTQLPNPSDKAKIITQHQSHMVGGHVTAKSNIVYSYIIQLSNESFDKTAFNAARDAKAKAIRYGKDPDEVKSEEYDRVIELYKEALPALEDALNISHDMVLNANLHVDEGSPHLHVSIFNQDLDTKQSVITKQFNSDDVTTMRGKYSQLQTTLSVNAQANFDNHDIQQKDKTPINAAVIRGASRRDDRNPNRTMFEMTFYNQLHAGDIDGAFSTVRLAAQTDIALNYPNAELSETNVNTHLNEVLTDNEKAMPYDVLTTMSQLHQTDLHNEQLVAFHNRTHEVFERISKPLSAALKDRQLAEAQTKLIDMAAKLRQYRDSAFKQIAEKEVEIDERVTDVKEREDEVEGKDASIDELVAQGVEMLTAEKKREYDRKIKEADKTIEERVDASLRQKQVELDAHIAELEAEHAARMAELDSEHNKRMTVLDSERQELLDDIHSRSSQLDSREADMAFKVDAAKDIYSNLYAINHVRVSQFGTFRHEEFKQYHDEGGTKWDTDVAHIDTDKPTIEDLVRPSQEINKLTRGLLIMDHAKYAVDEMDNYLHGSVVIANNLAANERYHEAIARGEDPSPRRAAQQPKQAKPQSQQAPRRGR